MNVVHVIILCLLSLLVGYEFGSWREVKSVRETADDLQAFHYKEIQLIIDKILESRKDTKDGD